MDSPEKKRALPEEEEAAITELEQRPSTFPNIGVDLTGYESEELARSVGNAVLGFLHLFGKLLNLELLHKVIVAYDYTGTLATLDRGVKTNDSLIPTKDELAEGVAMTSTMLADGELRTVIVLNALHMGVLAYPDDARCAEYRERMIHTLAHECAHVHDYGVLAKAFPGVKVERRLLSKDTILFEIASGCWTEYIASRLSAAFGEPHGTHDLENLFCSVLRVAKDRANAAIRQYRMHGDHSRLLRAVTAEYRRLLVYASYLLGHLDASGKDVTGSAPAAEQSLARATYFRPILDRLRLELNTMHRTYGQWRSIDVYEPLKQIAYDLLQIGGIGIEEQPEGLYVSAPYTPDTLPSLAEQAEFRKNRNVSSKGLRHSAQPKQSHDSE